MCYCHNADAGFLLPNNTSPGNFQAALDGMVQAWQGAGCPWEAQRGTPRMPYTTLATALGSMTNQNGKIGGPARECWHRSTDLQQGSQRFVQEVSCSYWNRLRVSWNFRDDGTVMPLMTQGAMPAPPSPPPRPPPPPPVPPR